MRIKSATACSGQLKKLMRGSGRRCDKSHRPGLRRGLGMCSCKRGAGHVHPIREYHPAWFVPASVVDPSEHLSRRASLLAVLR